MPNLKSSKKNLRKSKRFAARNAVVRDELHSLRRHLRIKIASATGEELKEIVRILTKKIDKAAKKHIIKKNTASRLKSRMMAKVNTRLDK